jgi:hypothetical protein
MTIIYVFQGHVKHLGCFKEKKMKSLLKGCTWRYYLQLIGLFNKRNSIYSEYFFLELGEEGIEKKIESAAYKGVMRPYPHRDHGGVH